MPDPDTGGAAQHAIRQTKTLAENIAASVRGGSKQPFHFHTLGMFVCREHGSAVAEIRGFRFSGFHVWWLWRTVYLAKLPRLERKVRVALDWTLALVFPRDFAQLRPCRERGVSIPALEDSALPPRRGSRPIPEEISDVMNPLRELQEFSQSVTGQCPEPVAIRQAVCKQAVNFSWERVSGIC